MSGTQARKLGKPLIQSAERVLDILELLAHDPGAMRSTEIATALGLHANTANNLVRTLFRRGYVTQKEDGRYCLGVQCYRLSTACDQWDSLRCAAQPLLQELADKTGDGAFLGVSENGRLLCLAQANGKGNVIVSFEQAWLNKFHCTAAGKAIIAHLDQEELNLIREQGELEKYTKKTITAWPKLLREIRLTKQRGYAICIDEAAEGIAAVGVPILKNGNHLLGAFAQSIPTYRIRNKEIAIHARAELLRNFAARLAEAYPG